MFLFWIFVVIAICAYEALKDSYDAHKHPHQTPDCFKPKPWQQDWIDKNKK